MKTNYIFAYMNILSNFELDKYNTFGIQAKSKFFLTINNLEDAQHFFKKLAFEFEPILILGGGSNILLQSDYDGLVLQNQIKGIELVKEDEEHVWLKVGAGENWHEFVLYTIENNWSGIENLSLIPGNVGASPMQNIGAYGVEVKNVIENVECVNKSNGAIEEFDNASCEFGYRTSIFKTSHKNQYFITHVTFRLNKKAQFQINYGAIKSELEKQGVQESELSAKTISDAVIAIRQSKLPDPKKLGNSGSFFKNPIVNKATYQLLIQEFGDMPAYPLENDEVKLAAGWLIEKAGWKGYRKGDAGVHEKQALVLVNYGNASGSDIYELSEQILQSVKAKFGVELEREVNII